MASWQAYIDTTLVGSGCVDKAAIYDAEGRTAWASSPGFTPTESELKAIVDAYKDKGGDSGSKNIFNTGFTCCSEKFITLRADDRSLYGKKGREGIIIVKTTQAILIAHYPETVQPGAATNAVEQLGDYLISVGY